MFFLYIIRRMIRAYRSCLIISASAFAFMLLIHAIDYALDMQGDRLEEALSTTPVDCVVSDLYGTKSDDLFISEKYIDSCISPESELASYITDVTLMRQMYSRIITEQGERLTELDNMVGINRLSADERLSELSGVTVTFFEGYSERDLEINSGCLLSEELISRYVFEPGGTIHFLMGDTEGNNRIEGEGLKVAIAETPYRAALTLIGSVRGIRPELIYCAWNDVCKAGLYLNETIYSERMTFRVADNHRIDEFRQVAKKHFKSASQTPPKQFLIDGWLSLKVFDATLVKTISSIEKNVMVLQALRPIIFALSVVIGVVLNFLSARGRRQEFAIMRSLGTPRRMVFSILFIEQLALSSLGILIALPVSALWSGTLEDSSIFNSAICLACFMLGAVAAVSRMISVNVMEIMKAKE